MKKLLSQKGKVLFFLGLIMLVLSGALWFANGGYMKIQKAEAVKYSDCTGDTATGSGCYSEKWTAQEILGQVWAYNWDGNSNMKPYVATSRINACKFRNWTTEAGLSAFAVPGSPGATNCVSGSAGSDPTGILMGRGDYTDSNNPVVTSWTVDGKINP